MWPLTGSDHKCVSSLAMIISIFCPLSWGKIASFILPSLAGSELASSTNALVCYLILLTPFVLRTPTYQSVHTVHNTETLYHPDSHPILVHSHQWTSEKQRSFSSRSINVSLTTNDHKRPFSDPRIPSFPSTSSGPAPTQVLRWSHYVCP